MSGADSGGALLARERVTAGARPREWIWFLHGIFGAGRNWRSVAERFVAERPSWGALLVDLRLHGGSRGFGPPHTLEACSDDLDALARVERAPAVLAGHSFGGKVALLHLERAAAVPREAWVIDSTPSAREPGGDAVRMLEALRELPDRFARREAAAEALVERGFPELVARWMATNLEEREGVWRWRFEPDEMEALLADFFRTDLWHIVEEPPEGTRLRFVKAQGSEVLPEAECDRVQAAGRDGRVTLDGLAGGHWLNVTAPEGLHRLFTEWTKP